MRRVKVAPGKGPSPAPISVLEKSFCAESEGALVSELSKRVSESTIENALRKHSPKRHVNFAECPVREENRITNVTAGAHSIQKSVSAHLRDVLPQRESRTRLAFSGLHVPSPPQPELPSESPNKRLGSLLPENEYEAHLHRVVPHSKSSPRLLPANMPISERTLSSSADQSSRHLEEVDSASEPSASPTFRKVAMVSAAVSTMKSKHKSKRNRNALLNAEKIKHEISKNACIDMNLTETEQVRHMEETRGTDRWMLHPKDPKHVMWDMWISGLLFITLVTLPLILAWPVVFDTLYGINLFIDLNFICDVVKNFCTVS